MAEVTDAGSKLAWKLNPIIGTTRAIEETCSLIHRSAITYSRIQEAWCNDEMTDRQTARLEKREADLERHITNLVESLPQSDDGHGFTVKFQGDPRGNTVIIIPPAGWERITDRWDNLGIGADN